MKGRRLESSWLPVDITMSPVGYKIIEGSGRSDVPQYADLPSLRTDRERL